MLLGSASKDLLRQAGEWLAGHSGVLQALLGINDQETLLSHPVVGASWATWVIENLLATAPRDRQPSSFAVRPGPRSTC